jgi:hypothetical protein
VTSGSAARTGAGCAGCPGRDRDRAGRRRHGSRPKRSSGGPRHPLRVAGARGHEGHAHDPDLRELADRAPWPEHSEPLLPRDQHGLGPRRGADRRHLLLVRPHDCGRLHRLAVVSGTDRRITSERPLGQGADQTRAARQPGRLSLAGPLVLPLREHVPQGVPRSGAELVPAAPRPATPTVSFPQPPPPVSTTYNLDFTVGDVGGSGLAFWRLEQREPGTAPWALVEPGTAPGAHSVSFTAALPGDTDEFRVVAQDRHGNRTVSPIRQVTAPP